MCTLPTEAGVESVKRGRRVLTDHVLFVIRTKAERHWSLAVVRALHVLIEGLCSTSSMPAQVCRPWAAVNIGQEVSIS